LIQQLYRKRVTGRLCLSDESGDESIVYLREGSAVHIERPNDLDRLDRVLADTGLVSERVLARAEEISRQQNKRLGLVLVDIGALAPDVLADAIRAQLRRKLIRLFFVRKGRYEVFLHEHDYGNGDELARIRLDPRSLIYPGIRTSYDDVRLMEELRPLVGFGFKLVTLPAGFIDALGMSAVDPVVKLLQERLVRLDELASIGPKPADSRSVVLALLYSDLLETERLADAMSSRVQMLDAGATSRIAQSLSPVPNARMPSRPPRITPFPPAEARNNMPPLPPPPHVRSGSGDGAPRIPVTNNHSASVAVAADIRQRVEALMPKIDDISLFELLGLTEAATPEQVSTAYMKGVRQFHPDRLTGLGMSDLTKDAERIMARYGEASAVLTDPKRRSEYVRKLRGQPSDADNARNILEAEQSFRQGEVLLKRGEYSKALERFTDAVKRNTAEVEYRAYLAWARYSESASSKPMLAADTIRIIRDALSERPHFARGLYWVGEIQKVQGDLESAEKSFRDCLEIDKEFIEAQRELRLFEMRRGKGKSKETAVEAEPNAPAKTGASALLNKLLRR
jgi:tetratricopeptide (TPR) repeat protein